MHTTPRHLRVDRRHISYLKFILEGYDGLATLSTVDARTGEVALSVAPGCEVDIERIIAFLKKEMLIEDVVAR